MLGCDRSDRNTLLFVGVSLVSGFGGTAMSLAAGLWVMGLTGSSSLAAVAGACAFVPSLAGPVLGALVDRLPRRPLLVWTSLTLAGLLLLLLAVRSADQLWLLYAVMLGYGVSYVLLDAGEAAILPDGAARRATRRTQRPADDRSGGHQTGRPAGRRRPIHLGRRTGGRGADRDPAGRRGRLYAAVRPPPPPPLGRAPSCSETDTKRPFLSGRRLPPISSDRFARSWSSPRSPC